MKSLVIKSEGYYIHYSVRSPPTLFLCYFKTVFSLNRSKHSIYLIVTFSRQSTRLCRTKTVFLLREPIGMKVNVLCHNNFFYLIGTLIILKEFYPKPEIVF